MMHNWPHACRGRRPAEDQRHYHFNESPTKSSTFAAKTLRDRHMSDKLSIGNKNHGSCVNYDTGKVSSRRPSAAWDIWDKVWRVKKKCLR